ncbi:dehydrogenase [Bifidobacterium leontopitheci]|uniref:Dehydrogenase n=2 Tax=Bifidobacterium leontopitheci TaxID=2650774 RepID=A0A6I1GDQ7_9BIFI|nr:dehydrogenase [Bifidobacterium leontopitheci]
MLVWVKAVMPPWIIDLFQLQPALHYIVHIERIGAEYTNIRIVPMPLDLTDPHSYDVLRDRLASAKPDVRLLASNAGMGSSRMFAEEDPQRLERLVQLNVTANTMAIRHCLPYMRRGSLRAVKRNKAIDLQHPFNKTLALLAKILPIPLIV